MLNVNPEWRWKLPDIQKSKFFNQTIKRYKAEGIQVGKDSMTINDKLIDMMK